MDNSTYSHLWKALLTICVSLSSPVSQPSLCQRNSMLVLLLHFVLNFPVLYIYCQGHTNRSCSPHFGAQFGNRSVLFSRTSRLNTNCMLICYSRSNGTVSRVFEGSFVIVTRDDFTTGKILSLHWRALRRVFWWNRDYFSQKKDLCDGLVEGAY